MDTVGGIIIMHENDIDVEDLDVSLRQMAEDAEKYMAAHKWADEVYNLGKTAISAAEQILHVDR